jgi:hypothetical protein
VVRGRHDNKAIPFTEVPAQQAFTAAGIIPFAPPVTPASARLCEVARGIAAGLRPRHAPDAAYRSLVLWAATSARAAG